MSSTTVNASQPAANELRISSKRRARVYVGYALQLLTGTATDKHEDSREHDDEDGTVHNDNNNDAAHRCITVRAMGRAISTGRARSGLVSESRPPLPRTKSFAALNKFTAPNRMVIFIKNETSNNKWTMLNYDANSPIFVDLLPVRVIEKSKDYHQNIMLEAKKKN